MLSLGKIHRLKAFPKGITALVCAATTLTVGAFGLFTLQAIAAPSFQEAVALYNSGKYAQAAGVLQSVKASNPNNPWVHYYLAMSEQAIGHIEQAKAEYQWVVSSRDPALAPQAATGLAQLSHVRTTGSGGGSSTVASVGAAGLAGGAGGGQKIAMGKVKKVLEFWATW